MNVGGFNSGAQIETFKNWAGLWPHGDSSAKLEERKNDGKDLSGFQVNNILI